MKDLIFDIMFYIYGFFVFSLAVAFICINISNINEPKRDQKQQDDHCRYLILNNYQLTKECLNSNHFCVGDVCEQ